MKDRVWERKKQPIQKQDTDNDPIFLGGGDDHELE